MQYLYYYYLQSFVRYHKHIMTRSSLSIFNHLASSRFKWTIDPDSSSSLLFFTWRNSLGIYSWLFNVMMNLLMLDRDNVSDSWVICVGLSHRHLRTVSRDESWFRRNRGLKRVVNERFARQGTVTGASCSLEHTAASLHPAASRNLLFEVVSVAVVDRNEETGLISPSNIQELLYFWIRGSILEIVRQLSHAKISFRLFLKTWVKERQQIFLACEIKGHYCFKNSVSVKKLIKSWWCK